MGEIISIKVEVSKKAAKICPNFRVDLTCTLGCVTFSKTSRYRDILKATVFGVFEDLKFKISKGSDQN